MFFSSKVMGWVNARFIKRYRAKKQLPKNAIYAKFQINTASKEKINADISRITITNEVIVEKINVDKGEEVTNFFVMHFALKRQAFDEKEYCHFIKTHSIKNADVP